MTTFNFGPIARTDAGSTHDTINLASFPLHIMLNALVASTNSEEFIAWLWHDLYKPVFWWVKTGKKDKQGNDELNWYHTPGIGAFKLAEQAFASKTGIKPGIVSTHHNKTSNFSFHEKDFISDQGDQVNLGAVVNYLQLSIASEPALPTVLVRSVITDAFIEVVTKDVANALRQTFIRDNRTPIDKVQFEFKTTLAPKFSLHPTDTEIWNKVGQYFDVKQEDNIFIMRHLTPVTKPEYEQFATTFTADLTGNPLLPHDMLNNVVSLAELLVLYQDCHTVIMAVPQPQLYTFDLNTIKQKTLDITRTRLNSLEVLTSEDGIDYLKIAFDTQIDIREVPGRLSKRPDWKIKIFRPLTETAFYPSDLLAQARHSSSGKICRLTGTPFLSNNIPSTGKLAETRLDKLFSGSFVDTEFAGLKGNLAPLTCIYAINSTKSGGAGVKGVPNRTSLRGAFAFLAPASHSAISEQSAKAVEIPPLDKGGRFTNRLNRITVTTQEFTLFQQMSRRIIADVWQKIAPNTLLPLPYLGAILLTHGAAQQIQQLLPELDGLLSQFSLRAYPFEIKEVKPAIEIALDIAIEDRKHASKHTLLKISPRSIPVCPNASVPLLVDDDIQIDVNKSLFDRIQSLTKLLAGLKRRKKRLYQKDVWLKLLLSGNDPLTAVFESTQATTDTRKLAKGFSLDHIAFNEVENFWNDYIEQGDFAQSWKRYEELNETTTTTLEEFPALPLIIKAFQKSNKKGANNDSSAT